MAAPTITGHMLRVRFGEPTRIRICGTGFVGDTDGNIKVKLTSTAGYTWRPKVAYGQVISDTEITVIAVPGPKPERSVPGIGDLTITVTNMNAEGASSNAQPQQIYYSG